MAERVITVDLQLKATQYKTEAEQAAAKTEALKESAKGADKEVDKLGKDSVKAAAELKALGVTAGDTKVKISELGPTGTNVLGTIDAKLKETKESAQQFAAAFNATGDMQAFMSWKKAVSDVSDLEKLRTKLTAAVKDAKDLKDKLTSDDNGMKGFWGSLFDATGIPKLISNFKGLGLQAGDAFGKGFKGFLDAMPGELKFILGGIIATVIVGSLSAIGAMVNGLLLSGLGLGGIGALIIGQIKSPAVTGAVEQLGHSLMNQLGAISAPFTGNTVSGIGSIGAGLQSLLAQLTPALQKLGQMIEPLAQGLARMLQSMGPGLSKALEASLPVLQTLIGQMPGLGRAFSDFFKSLAGGGKGATEGLIYLFRGLDGTIRTLGQTIEILSKVFQGFIAFADYGTGVLQRYFDLLGKVPGLGWVLEHTLGAVVDKNHKMFSDIHEGSGAAKDGLGGIASAAVDTAGAMQSLNPQLGQAATQAQQAATAFQNLSKGLDAAFNRTMNVDQATLQLATSMTGLADSVQKNGTSLKENTKEGQANLGVIQQTIGNINSLRDANIANGKGIDYSNQQYQAQLDQLQQTLIKLGFNKDAVQALIDKYRAIPGQVSTTVNVLGLDSSIYKLDSVTQTLNDLNGKITTTYLVVDTQTGQTQKIVHNQGYNRWGGIYQHAETGLLNAGIYSSASPARYAFAEPATGGEAFVPRLGDYGRSTAILDQAARWYGGRFAAGGMGGGAVRVEMAFTGAAAGSLGSVIMGMVRTGEIQIRTSQLVAG